MYMPISKLLKTNRLNQSAVKFITKVDLGMHLSKLGNTQPLLQKHEHKNFNSVVQDQIAKAQSLVNGKVTQTPTGHWSAN